MNKVHKILFFTSSLGGGGAEMHLLRLLNHFDYQKFKISLALVRSGGSYESKLTNQVEVHYLPTGKINSSTLRMLRAIIPLRRLIQQQKPDIICSVMDHANLAAILARQKMENSPKLILCVQNQPLKQHQWLLHLMKTLYSKADGVIALSQGVADDLNKLIPSIRQKITVIYNAGFEDQIISLAKEPLPDNFQKTDPLIVACGRLTEQKGFSYLIEAFSQLRHQIPAQLWIIGEGKLKSKLERQIRDLNLEDHVKLLGFQDNPYKYMASGDVFILSSLFEGFGNVIVEAMACETAVISTKCPSGPDEIIDHGINGFLVPVGNSEELAKSTIDLLKNSELRQKISFEGHNRANNFHAQVIANNYEKYFLKLIHLL